MKRLKTIANYSVTVIIAASLLATCANADRSDPKLAQNIIFMVPDGMGLADVTAARIYKSGPDGAHLVFENLAVIGYQSTHSANGTVTDSAAAASAWATGTKYNNGEISCHDDDSDGVCDGGPVTTILDIAHSKGKSTGLVVTSDISHATPAAFGANVHNRKCEEEIARQFITRGIDVLLGGGIAKNDEEHCMLEPSQDNYFEELVREYERAGYTNVDSKEKMTVAVANGAEKLLGLFKQGGKTQELFRVDTTKAYPADEPTLKEMTKTALHILGKNKNGFFLLVEGSQIDWANHDNSVQGQIAETLAFDGAVQAVLDWVDAKARRQHETLVIVVADHETGGFAINGPHEILSEQGQIIEDGWTSAEHTAVDTLIWAQGPNSSKLAHALDNTDLFYVMEEALK